MHRREGGDPSGGGKRAHRYPVQQRRRVLVRIQRQRAVRRGQHRARASLSAGALHGGQGSDAIVLW